MMAASGTVHLIAADSIEEPEHTMVRVRVGVTGRTALMSSTAGWCRWLTAEHTMYSESELARAVADGGRSV